MRTIPRVLAAGVVDTYPVYGRYFRLMTTVGAVNVDLLRAGAVVYEAVNVQAGFYAIPEGGFDAIRILSGTLQTIQIAVTNGNGGYDRSTGDVNILPGSQVRNLDSNGNTMDSVGTFAAMTADMRYLLTQDGGFSYGVAYASQTNLPAALAVNIFTGAANVNGAIVWSAGIITGAAGSNIVTMLAKATAPTGMVDGDVIAQGLSLGANFGIGPVLPRPVRIAAGKGLWVISSVAETGSNRYATYSLL